MQVCHFGFALSFYCPFFVILLCFGKCKTNASKKTPNLRTAKHHRPKEIEKNADHWNLPPPILTVSSNHPESAIYIFFSLSVPMALGIFPYLSGTHFEKRPDRLEALVQVAPRPWVRPLFTIPADHRTRAPNRDAASKCAAVLAMPCHASNMGSPGSRQEWSLTPRPAISVLGITIETSIDYNGCRNDVPAGKKNMEK
jgi:hypothetical protein